MTQRHADHAAGADGEHVFTNGPFGETDEVVTGFYSFTASSPEQARELAALCPDAGLDRAVPGAGAGRGALSDADRSVGAHTGSIAPGARRARASSEPSHARRATSCSPRTRCRRRSRAPSRRRRAAGRPATRRPGSPRSRAGSPSIRCGVRRAPRGRRRPWPPRSPAPSGPSPTMPNGGRSPCSPATSGWSSSSWSRIPHSRAEARVELALRFVCGLPTARIAEVFLVSEPTMAARITRAKKRVHAAGLRFVLDDRGAVAERMPDALTTIYLLYTVGHRTADDRSAARCDRPRPRRSPDDAGHGERGSSGAAAADGGPAGDTPDRGRRVRDAARGGPVPLGQSR